MCIGQNESDRYLIIKNTYISERVRAREMSQWVISQKMTWCVEIYGSLLKCQVKTSTSVIPALEGWKTGGSLELTGHLVRTGPVRYHLKRQSGHLVTFSLRTRTHACTHAHTHAHTFVRVCGHTNISHAHRKSLTCLFSLQLSNLK